MEKAYKVYLRVYKLVRSGTYKDDPAVAVINDLKLHVAKALAVHHAVEGEDPADFESFKTGVDDMVKGAEEGD